MTLHVYTRPCALTIVSFRLFGEFRLVHVFFSFGHGEGCGVVFRLLLVRRRRANGDGLSSDYSTRVDKHRETDTGRDSTAADAQEIVGGTTMANNNACAISLCHCVEHDDERIILYDIMT
jgi:hypothetical protein